MSTNISIPQEYADMHKAFQEFMLGGSTAVSTPSPQRHNTNKKQTQLQRSVYKQHQSAAQAFFRVLVDDWLHVDDQLGRIVDSIANLRRRLWVISGRLNALHALQADALEQEESDELADSASSYRSSFCSWKSYGYRGSASFIKSNQIARHRDERLDLELALSHSLLMHENMMTTCRKQLMPLLQEAQQMLGRRLEDFMISVADADDVLIRNNEDDAEEAKERSVMMNKMQTELDDCVDLFRAAAEEVHRKQEMVQECLLDTVSEGLLQPILTNANKKASTVEQQKTPLAIAKTCSAKWPRRHSSSALYGYRDLLDRIVHKVAQQSGSESERRS